MSSTGQLEYYVGMRVLAFGRQASIHRVHAGTGSYDLIFTDNNEVMVNVRAELLKPFEDTLAVAKMVGTTNPPPAYQYTVSGGTNYQSVSACSTVPQYPQQSQYQYPASQQPQQQQYYVGAVQPGVSVHSNNGPIQVTATPTHLSAVTTLGNNTAQNALKVPGFEHSPPQGQPFRDLFDCGTPFWMACCCPCVLGGQVAQKIQYTSYFTVVSAYLFLCLLFLILSIVLSGAFQIYLLLWVMWSCFVMAIRSKVRHMWRIPGDSCDDCSISYCCTACSLAQIAQHVFAFRPSDSATCTADGTPDWQRHQMYAETSLPMSTPQPHAAQPHYAQANSMHVHQGQV